MTLPGCWPAAEEWSSLEHFLQHWLQMWETEKIYADTWHNILLRHWTVHDLDRTIRLWERLLQAIESRLPHHAQRQVAVFRSLVSEEVLDSYASHTFTNAFLSAARAPSVPCTRIAPGIATFTSESYDALYGSEAQDSDRIRTIGQRGLQDDDIMPSILFAATNNVPEPPVQGLDSMEGF